jgi:hypothetical protein
MKKLTLKEWNKKGRWIKKGSKAVGFNDSGDALFTKDQTKRREVYAYEGNTNYNQDRYYFGGDNPDQMDYDLGLCGQI